MKNGILLVDKEAGLTSRDVDNALQKRFATRKVGHLGTLDPFATGLLIVGINNGTKFLPYLDDSRKSYLATLKLGETTSSLDPDTPVTETKEMPSLTEKAVADVLRSFIGKSEQLPPMTSAIKVDGEPLYKAAHEGREVERKTRSIEVYSLNLVELKKDAIVFTCSVSRGTYIRVLGADIARKLGTIGYLTSLRRVSIGGLLVAKAKKLADVSEDDFLDCTLAMTAMKHIEIDSADETRIKNGAPMTLAEDYGERVLLTLHGEALAVYKRANGIYYIAERGLF
jgi:tRNA pseudouridine55 synthase